MFTNKILEKFLGKKALTVNDKDPLMTDHDLLIIAVRKINELSEKIKKLEGEQ